MNASALPRRVILAAFAALSSGAMADAPVQPGGWEMKAVITARENPSSPPKTLTESTARVCLTKDFLAKDPYLTPGIDQDKMEKKGAKCSISDPRRAANSASNWASSGDSTACVLSGSRADATIVNGVLRIEKRSYVSGTLAGVTCEPETAEAMLATLPCVELEVTTGTKVD